MMICAPSWASPSPSGSARATAERNCTMCAIDLPRADGRGKVRPVIPDRHRRHTCSGESTELSAPVVNVRLTERGQFPLQNQASALCLALLPGVRLAVRVLLAFGSRLRIAAVAIFRWTAWRV